MCFITSLMLVISENTIVHSPVVFLDRADVFLVDCRRSEMEEGAQLESKRLTILLRRGRERGIPPLPLPDRIGDEASGGSKGRWQPGLPWREPGPSDSPDLRSNATSRA